MVPFRHIIGFCTIITSLWGPQVWAESTAQEASIKAAIIFNLVRFSDWPADSLETSTDGMTLCTLTSRRMQTALESLTGKPIKGHKLEVQHLEAKNPNFGACQILYLSDDTSFDRVDYDDLNRQNILTIGNSKTHLQQGAGMWVHRQGKRVRFSINQKAMKAAGIKPSSKILNLAVKAK